MKKKNIFAKKIIVAILIMQMIVMTCLSVMVIMEITKNSKNTAINNLADNRTGEKPDCG